MGKVTWLGWSKPGDHIPQEESLVFGENLKPPPPEKPKPAKAGRTAKSGQPAKPVAENE